MSYLKQFQSLCEDASQEQVTLPLPLFPGQYDIWLEQQLYPDDYSNHFHFVARISREINPDILRKAICRLAERHEEVRTIFTLIKGIPIRQITSPNSVNLSVEQCSNLGKEDLYFLIQTNFKKPFALSIDPPYRFILYQRSALENYLQIVTHHIAATIKSYAKIPYELAYLYNSELNETSIKLPEKHITYSHFVQKYYDYLKSDRNKYDRDYWLNYLSGSLPTPVLPLDKLSDSSNLSIEIQHFSLSNELNTKLKQLALSQNASFFSLITAIFQLLICRYTKQEEIIVGIPNDTLRSMGNKDDFNQFFGYSINTLPLRIKIPTDENFSLFLTQVHNHIQDMAKHRQCPLSQIVEDLIKTNGPTHAKLFKILVVSQKVSDCQQFLLFGVNRQDATVAIQGLKYESTGIGHIPTGRFDLALAILETSNEETFLSLHYNSSIFSKLEISRIGSNLLSTLKFITNNILAKISSISVLRRRKKLPA